MTDYLGIDVAKWQGNINWAKVKKAGVKLAILKVTQKNNTVEPSFERNYAGCKAQNIPVGCYRYVYARTVSEALREARSVATVLKGRDIPCGVWLDMEDQTLLRCGKSTLAAVIEAERKVLEAAGYTVGIYCNQYWYNSVLPSHSINLPWWIAKFGSNNGKKQNHPVIKSGQVLYAWQYTSKGRVNGIQGAVDLDAVYVAPPGTTKDNSTKPTLRKGDRGEAVKELQRLLNKHDHSLQVDGIWGVQTDSAVRCFQYRAGLVVDGIVGPKTWGKLME